MQIARARPSHDRKSKRTRVFYKGFSPEFCLKHCETRFHFFADCNRAHDCNVKVLYFVTTIALACVVRDTTVMWDAIFILATAAFFALSLAYVKGCQRL